MKFQIDEFEKKFYASVSFGLLVETVKLHNSSFNFFLREDTE